MPVPQLKAQPAAGATTQVVTGAGVLHKIMVQAFGTAACDIYDNTATAGTPIFTVPTTATVGAVYDLQVSFSAGLRVVAGVGAQLTLTYTGG